jgi:hypothetical protein
MSNTVTITGKTYPVREQLKALGGRWNVLAQGWDVPADKADAARALLPAVAAKPARARNWRCPNPRDCGDPCCDGNCGY